MAELYDPLERRMREGRDIGFVYFIQIRHNGPIKIGWSAKPDKRLHEIQASNPEPIRMLGLMPGTMALEKEMHQKYADARIKGEWFNCHMIYDRVIDELIDFGILASTCIESRNIPEAMRNRTYFCELISV